MREDPVNLISDEEPLTHIILHKSKTIPTKNKVRYTAFQPSSKTLSISTFRIDGILGPVIWNLGVDFVGEVIAQGDLLARNYNDEGLQIQPTELPHPLRTNVIGWPEDKQKQKYIANNLAENAILMIRHP